MPRETFATRWNQGAIEQQFQIWKDDPDAVDERWRIFFEGFELAGRSPSPERRSEPSDASQTGVVRLIFAYRDIGHFEAHLDPLNDQPGPHPLLDLHDFGLSEADLDRTFDCSAFAGMGRATLRELIAALRETYCRTLGVEFTHIQDRNVRNWLRERMESGRNRPEIPRRQKLRVLMTLHHAELFERFLQKRYISHKRFSLEGAETLIPVLDALVQKAPSMGIREYILGMAHRGRLNVLANILQKPDEEIFAEFEDNFIPDSVDGDGDVKYHQGFSSDVVTTSGEKIHLSLTPNPSHLEAVNPVVQGRTRCKQRLFRDGERRQGVPILIHGDAAFAGQGMVAETLNLSELKGYRTGGTVHLIVNNQIGFTTAPSDARSTTYCTDVAKMIQAPIFHVNAEDPLMAVYVAELALEFRQEFRRDVLIDLYCYRKHGHNEGDEPSFTQPMMYQKIKGRPGVVSVYTGQLLNDGVIDQAEAKAIGEEFQADLERSQQQVKGTQQERRVRRFQGTWVGMTNRYSHEPADTRVERATLDRIAAHITRAPDDFKLNSKIAKQFEARRETLGENGGMDWAFCEALAFGSLLLEGHPVRVSGQDSGRGTFSQRHAVLFDMDTGRRYTPLRHLGPDQGPFDIHDSLLSEAAILGFEFGYSLDDPDSLVCWEAQFGDFANGAQVIIDQFIVPSESKWQRSSGVVLLLPHGYEGQGPEHSSARLERFLQMSAEENIQVCNLTTPAQYFHVLRRQLRRPFRKPLVIMTPKSLLRHDKAVSTLGELAEGRFHELLDDPTADPARVRRVLLCSGKVYYDLLAARDGRDDVAIVRLEQFYPFHEDAVAKILRRYSSATSWVWVQEESHNMGGWSFVEPRLRQLGCEVCYVGRDASSSPATGSLAIHKREQEELVSTALTGQVPHLVRSVNGNGNGKVGHPRKVAAEKRDGD